MWSQSQATHLKMRRKKDILSSPAIRNQLVHGPAWNLPWYKVNGLQAPWQHPPHSRAHSLRHTIIVKCTRSLLETRLWPYFPKTSQKPSPHAGAITISTWADVLQEVKEPHKTAQLVSLWAGKWTQTVWPQSCILHPHSLYLPRFTEAGTHISSVWPSWIES